MHTELAKVDGDDDESAQRTELDDCFGFLTIERNAADDEFDFARFAVALALDDFARKDDTFEIKDREVVIVKFFRSMERYDIVQRTDTVADLADRALCHWPIVTEDSSLA